MKKIEELRKAKGLSLAAVARLAGMRSRQMWHRLESGRVNPTLATLEAVASVLDVPVQELIK